MRSRDEDWANKLGVHVDVQLESFQIYGHHWYMPASSQRVMFEVEVSNDLARFALPRAVDRRLQYLLDKQDSGEILTDDERAEAEGLVELADMLTLLRLRAERAAPVPE